MFFPAPKMEGISFAWLPKWVGDGKVWLEWVHWERVPSWGWGSDETIRYHRWVPEDRYSTGERRGSVDLDFPASLKAALDEQHRGLS